MKSEADLYRNEPKRGACTAITPELKARVRRVAVADPEVSVVALAQRFHLAPSTICWILRREGRYAS